jgi:hypothetical protein
MTELGVYILGATALAILAAAGIVLDGDVLVCAVIASGAAYLSQNGAHAHQILGALWALVLSIGAMIIAFGAWAYGVWLLL